MEAHALALVVQREQLVHQGWEFGEMFHLMVGPKGALVARGKERSVPWGVIAEAGEEHRAPQSRATGPFEVRPTVPDMERPVRTDRKAFQRPLEDPGLRFCPG